MRTLTYLRTLSLLIGVSYLGVGVADRVPLQVGGIVPVPFKPDTILSGDGRIVIGVNDNTVDNWRRELHSQAADSDRTKQLHLFMGEYSLVVKEDPEAADWHFRRVLAHAPANDPYRGAALYDIALTQSREGAYADSAASFKALIYARPPIRGYDRNSAALMMRQEGACAGYHRERSDLGIPEPLKLDPLCGVSGLAISLRSQGLPFDKPRLLSACQVTGLGNNGQDLLNACPKLGLVGRAVTATDKGLRELPKPVIAYVERDHFIAVTKADRSGVDYICSDCGAWPGGEVQLSWDQWHALGATFYISAVKPGSWRERKMERLLGPDDVLAHGSPLGFFGVGVSAAPVMATSHEKSPDVTPFLAAQTGLCGLRPSDLHCSDDCPVPTDCSGTSSGAGDPVDLASGEELYSPAADIAVYNPLGPSVVWGRNYGSMRSLYPDPQHFNSANFNDFGVGWSNSYSVSIYDPNNFTVDQVNQGFSTPIRPDSSTMPGAGLTWDIYENGAFVASSATPNGWTISGWSSTGGSVTPPSPASGRTYRIRWTDGTIGVSAPFDVNAPQQTTQGVTGKVPSNGGQATSQTWEIFLGGVSIASAAAPNGWAVPVPLSGAVNTADVTPPFNAAVSVNYELRCQYSTGLYNSGTFRVFPQDELLQAGTANPKYYVSPSGATIQFTLPSLPTATNTPVHCSVAAGHRMAIDWYYDPNSTGGYQVITNPDSSKWIISASPKVVITDSYLVYVLTRIADRDGKGINFNYQLGTGINQSWIPLLATINDDNGAALLTLVRMNDGSGHLASVSDRYGRSVYYQQNDSSGNVLTQVSHVVATGTASPPARWTYSYANVIIPGYGGTYRPLHTISVPSPTGSSGSSTSTIDYNTTTGFVADNIDGNGNKRAYTTVDTNHSKVSVYNSSGGLVYSHTVGYDNQMNWTTDTDGTNSNVIVTRTYSDPNDPFKPSTVADATGHTYSFTWDQFGDMQSVTAPTSSTAYTWDYTAFSLGRLTSMAESAGTTHRTATSFTYYEPSGRVHTMNYPTPGTSGTGSTVTVSYTYDSLGNVLTVTSPGNNAAGSKTLTYNYTADGAYTQAAAKGQPLTVTDGLSRTAHYRYNSQGQVSTVTDPLGNVTTLSFDPYSGQLQTKTFPPATSGGGSPHESFTYAYSASQGFNGGPMLSAAYFDSTGAKVRQVDNTLGVEGETLATGNATLTYSYAYDALYRPTLLSDGNAHSTQYNYDSVGHLSSVNYPGGETVQNTSFDGDGRILSRTDPKGQVANFTYNGPGGLLSDAQYPASPSLNLHVTSYDGFARPTAVTDGVGTLQYAYDDVNELTSTTRTYTGLAAKTISYGYYNDSSRQSMSTPAGSFSYLYDSVGRPQSMTNPYSETTSWSFVPSSDRLSTQTLGNGAVTTYSYDLAGRLIELKNATSGGATLSDYSSIGYDGFSNLQTLTASIPASSSYSGSITYSYNGLNELTQETTARLGGFTYNYGYDAAGNPTTFRGTAQTFNSRNQNTASGYGYDANGNPTTYGGNTLTYDVNDHMAAFGSIMTAGYTGDGLRAWKQNASGRTYFLYDGDTPVIELDSSGNVHAVNTFGANGLVSRKIGNFDFFYTFDPQGGTAQRLDPNQTIVSSHMQTAYGWPYSSATNTDPFRGYGAQAGYYWDYEVSLYLCGERYYDPLQGRFVTRDPIGYAGGGNLYSYVAMNPTNDMDPSGLTGSEMAGSLGAWGRASDAATCDFWGDKPGGVEIARVATTVTDLVVGGAQSILSIGSGLGTFAGNPNWSTGLCALGDLANIGLLVSGGGELAALGEGGAGELAAGELEDSMSSCAVGEECFVGGTPVQTESASGLCQFSDANVGAPGVFGIDEVRCGNSVETRNPSSGATEVCPVLQSTSHIAEVVETIRFGDTVAGPVLQTLTCTPEHPFFTTHGIRVAGDLRRGDVVETRDGHGIVVQGGRTQTGQFMVYNLGVGRDHSYFVGLAHGGIWVHNACPRPDGFIHPKTGVRFEGGYPVFDAFEEVQIEPTGDPKLDRLAANKATGRRVTPNDKAWHHHQDYGRMQLVDKYIHSKTGHTGGFSIWSRGCR